MCVCVSVCVCACVGVCVCVCGGDPLSLAVRQTRCVYGVWNG